MKLDAFLKRSPQLKAVYGQARLFLHSHGRRYASSDAVQRQTNFWIPPVSLTREHGLAQDVTQLLSRAGYLRQAYSGIYHMLPLGLRVQNKIERLIDKHMSSIGASKVSLSSISSQELWERSGRLGSGTEFFKFSDRKDGKWLLSPTHEEEITSLVGDVVQTYKDLPVRLYQIGRKYRDEMRPRGGLLRGREFVMKDLYTFDGTESEARATYDAVRTAYANFFDELRVDFLEARADSGNMGGSLSHEYHLTHASGEDNIIRCSNCGLERNEEFVDEVKFDRKRLPMLPYSNLNRSAAGKAGGNKNSVDFAQYTVASKDHRALVRAFAPKLPGEAPLFSSEGEADPRMPPPQLNIHVVKAAFENVLDLDAGIEGPTTRFLDSVIANKSTAEQQEHTIHYLIDDRINRVAAFAQIELDQEFFGRHRFSMHIVTSHPDSPNKLDLLKRRVGDACPNCQKETIEIQKAIEVGHTFHLGTRYSAKLGAKIVQANGISEPIQMGCHGIGVSRLVAAVAACLVDEKGLNWPCVIAPFQVVIIAKRGELAEQDQVRMDLAYNIAAISTDPDSVIDILVDDRAKPLPWKLNDADFIGYPVMVIFGRAWDNGEGKVEVQCRQLKMKREVALDDVPTFVQDLLKQL